ncbi:MAG TPA: nucleotidyltransferase family protein [Pyrinomonadaceae bacterium]|nr:nucleotidyltransferase family protein [Pyrinomonadaceae bacterium]
MTKAKDQRQKTSAVAAIILAAGQSSRMGAFKPLLPFGSKTVIETCIENIRDGGIEDIVVVAGMGPRADELHRQLQNCGVIFAINPDSNSAMSASVVCGVHAVPQQAKAVVINPVDHAAVSGEVVRMLIREWQKGARLVKPTWNKRGGHPVLVDLHFRNELLMLDATGDLKKFFSDHGDEVRRVETESKYIARDMDTWDDYRALHQEVFGVPAPELSVGERA